MIIVLRGVYSLTSHRCVACIGSFSSGKLAPVYFLIMGENAERISITFQSGLYRVLIGEGSSCRLVIQCLMPSIHTVVRGSRGIYADNQGAMGHEGACRRVLSFTHLGCTLALQTALPVHSGRYGYNILFSATRNYIFKDFRVDPPLTPDEAYTLCSCNKDRYLG